MDARRREGGFTLIELMVVVAIIAIVSTLLISVSSRTYGANSRTIADQVAATLNNARIRAVATRRIHRVMISPQELQVWMSETTGLVDDGDVSDGNDLFVERIVIPHGVSIWDVQAQSQSLPNVASVTENPSLYYEIKFKPDGTSSGGTAFVHDTNNSEYRVLVYRVTGSVYARQTW
jgi:type II secretion system protein H